MKNLLVRSRQFNRMKFVPIVSIPLPGGRFEFLSDDEKLPPIPRPTPPPPPPLIYSQCKFSCDMMDNSYIYIYTIYITYACIIYRIYSYPIFSIYNIYLQHIHYESALYVYSWMGCRHDLHICNSQQQEIGLPHPLICIMLLSTP